MADTKTSALTAQTTVDADDLLYAVDVSDTTMAPSGTSKKATRELLQTYNAGTLTTDKKVLDLSATWNAAGVTFQGIDFTITDTASGASSNAFRIRGGSLGTAEFFRINKDGTIRVTNTNAANIHLTAAATANVGLSFGASITGVYYKTATKYVAGANNAGVMSLASDVPLAWAATTTADTNGFDLYLSRDAADTLAQRRTTNAQTFRLYRTFTDSSNYSRLSLGWSSSTAVIVAQGAGTGSNGNIAFGTAALATGATVGHLMIPSCAGTATGVPADIPTGQFALIYDSTNKKLGVYDGGWIWTAALT